MRDFDPVIAALVFVLLLLVPSVVFWAFSPYGAPPEKVLEAVSSVESRIAYVCRLKTVDGTWKSGPSCYALAEFLNDRCFHNNLRISTSYFSDRDSIQIVMGSVYFKDKFRDHVWLEAHLGDATIFADPTHGQFCEPDCVVKVLVRSDKDGYRRFLGSLGYSDISVACENREVNGELRVFAACSDMSWVPSEWVTWKHKLALGKK